MENFIYILCGLLGVVFHCLAKAKSLIDYAKKANVAFGFKDYLEKDFIAIAMSLCSVFLWFLIFPEVGKVRPNVLLFTRCSFGAMGLLGSWIVQTFISSAKSYIMNIVDKKTNIADNKPELFADDEIGGDNPPIKKDEK
jgi:hypothetical protein